MIVDLPDALIARIAGRDAERYLNARLSNHIKALADGEWIDAAALNPQGKIEGIYQVKRLEKEEFLISCDGGDHTELINSVKRYIVADRVTLTDLSNEYRLIHITSPLTASFRVFAERTRNRVGVEGKDQIVLRASIVSHDFAVDNGTIPQSEYQLLRLKTGLFVFPQELSGISISEINYNNLVSFKKGCYVGQELVEKIDSFASAPKVLVRILILAERSIALGTEVVVDGERVGKVLASASSHGYPFSICVARVRNDRRLAARTARLSDCEGSIVWEQQEQIHV